MILVILLTILFAANWYLKYRLEGYLRSMLSEKVAEATDGVYKLDFDHLSIGLFSGELLVEGINLRPDSLHLNDTIYANKKLDEYVKIKIGSIYFKGVNLTWRTNYKKLKFGLFEVKNADIDIFNMSKTKTVNNQTPMESFDLYQIISSYIDVLTVKKIRLKNSSVSYRFTDEDGFVSRYALHDINFEANGFLLDENSESSGNLLYSDNFNFHVNTPQRLLSNAQFVLQTDQMIFDTKDSIIQIKNIELSPKLELWERVNKLPDSYLQGKINSINVKGLYFTRSGGANYVAASAFDINYPAIEYFVTDKESMPKLPSDSIQADSLDFSWSLYSIISPILNKVSIDAVSVNDANFKYSQSFRQDTSVYTLDKVNLIALDFQVDSLSELNTDKRFLYSKGFGLRADGLKGADTQKNHIISADHMILNTLDRIFQIENIVIEPIKTNTNNDYILGSVDFISIRDLDYSQGLGASSLEIKNPKLEYVRVASVRKYEDKSDETKMVKNGTNVWQQVSPFFNHLFVKRIVLDGGVLRFTDKVLQNRYNLYGLSLDASNLLIDQNTINTSEYMSAFDNLDFEYGKFEGIWITQNQKIESQRTVFSKKNQNFKIENLKISPYITTGKNKSKVENQMNMSVPLIDFEGLQFNFSGFYLKNLKISTLNIVSPKVYVTQLSENNISSSDTKAESPQVSGNQMKKVIENIDLIRLKISNAEVKYVSNYKKDTLSNTIKILELDNLSWKVGGAINLGKVFLNGSTMSMTERVSNNRQVSNKENYYVNNEASPIYTGINISSLDIKNSKILVQDPNKKLKINIPHFGFTNLDWNREIFDLNTININNPEILLLEFNSPIDTLQKKQKSVDNNIYQKLKGISNQISLKSIHVSEANINYTFSFKEAPAKNHNLSKANLSLEGLQIDNVKEKYNIDDIGLNIKDFHYPSSNGFYSFQIKEVNYNNRSNRLKLDSIALVPAYPKMEFVYKNPNHADWFDIRVRSVALSGINLPKYISENVLFADTLSVDYVLLQNFKNQNIEIQHNIMPMIYEGLQDLPLKLAIKRANVRDFNIIYEELPKNGKIASKIVFTNMNGRLKGLTNIVTTPDQFIDLSADGRFMETGNFAARWMLPVSKNYDCFELDANMKDFKLTDLNPIIEPMSPVTIADGLVKDVTFSIEGSSIGAQVQMLMFYNDLSLIIQKGSNREKENTLLTKVTNKILKTNNPNKLNSKPRQPNLSVTRDPYHSTFNYLWQILQPPLVESVGISQGKQNFIRKVSAAISSVKNIFKRDKKKKDED